MALFKTPEYTLIGSKALEEAKPYLKKCGKKALIVTGKHVVLSGMMAELKKGLLCSLLHFTKKLGILLARSIF